MTISAPSGLICLLPLVALAVACAPVVALWVLWWAMARRFGRAKRKGR